MIWIRSLPARFGDCRWRRGHAVVTHVDCDGDDVLVVCDLLSSIDFLTSSVASAKMSMNLLTGVTAAWRNLARITRQSLLLCSAMECTPSGQNRRKAKTKTARSPEIKSADGFALVRGSSGIFQPGFVRGFLGLNELQYFHGTERG